MQTMKTVQREVEIIDDTICNWCGKSCKHTINIYGDSNFCGLIEATVEGNYGSVYLEDMKAYTFSLCEKCLSDLFQKFKYPPEMYDYI